MTAQQNKKLTDPVEKLVETLFFSILLQLNSDKHFFFAPLDGKPEQYWGDAFARSGGQVFAFEFKRDLNGVKKELGKFGSTTPSHFLKLVSSQFGKEWAYAQKLKGHGLLTLSKFNGVNIEIKPDKLSEVLELYDYLPVLCDETPKVNTNPTKILFLNEGMGLDDAIWYFNHLNQIKSKKNDTSSASCEEIELIGFFSDAETGSLHISTQEVARFV
jgi:hypothetical protein